MSTGSLAQPRHRYHSCLHFVDEKTEAHRGPVTGAEAVDRGVGEAHGALFYRSFCLELFHRAHRGFCLDFSLSNGGRVPSLLYSSLFPI